MKLLLLERPLDRGIIADRQVEYFGPWAQPIDTPEDLLPARFDPYPTPDILHAASDRAIEEAHSLYEPLTEILNNLTGLNFSKRFWKFYLGDHIILLTSKLHDIRMRHLALPDKDYVLGLPDCSEINTPYSWAESESLFYDDYFNCYAMAVYLRPYFKNIEFLKYQKFGRKKITNVFTEYLPKLSKNSLCRNFRKIGLFLSSHFGLPREKMAYGNCSLIWDDYNLEDFNFKRLKNLSLLQHNIFDIAAAMPLAVRMDKQKRDKLKNSLPLPYGELLSISLPLLAVEGLPCLIETINKENYLEKFAKIERIYTNGQAFNTNGLNRALFALLAEGGKKILSIQHGGGANYFANSGMYMDRIIADEYISWGSLDLQRGWPLSVNNHKSISSIYLSHIKQKYPLTKRKRYWDVLFLFLEEYRHTRWISSPQFPDLAQDYYKRQRILLDFFSKDKKLAIKAYPETFGWNQIKWIRQSYPQAKVFLSGRFLDYAMTAEIIIVDYHSTGFLEMLVINKPFLATWDRRWFKGARLFEDFIDKLKNAGIFYEHPQELIKSYNEITYSGIDAWWNMRDRQNVIKEMADNFAMTSDKIDEIWTEELKER